MSEAAAERSIALDNLSDKRPGNAALFGPVLLICCLDVRESCGSDIASLIVLAALLLILPHQDRSSDLVARADVPTVDYCELLREPASYDKKVIRVKALYVAGFEVAAFEQAACDKDRSTWVEFDQSESSCTDKKVSKAFNAIFHPPRKRQKGVYEIPGPFRAELVAIGRFEGPKPGIAVGSEGQRILTGHGHMERTRHKRASLLSCVGEPLKRGVRRLSVA